MSMRGVHCIALYISDNTLGFELIFAIDNLGLHNKRYTVHTAYYTYL